MYEPTPTGNFLLTTFVGGIVSLVGWLLKRDINLFDKKLDEIVAGLKEKVDDDRCKERRTTCAPCRDQVKGLTEDLDAAITCINKHVDDCNI